MKKLLRALLPAALMSVIAGVSQAQYVTTGPNGGSVFCFYNDNGRLLTAGTGGVYFSNDAGKSWAELATSPAAFSCDAIYSIAASGGDMYAGSQQTGIYHSHDGGGTWTASISGLSVAPGAPYTDVEVAGPNVLAIRPDIGTLYYSNDQGVNWNQHNLAILNAFAQYLSVHNGDVFVSTPTGLFKSTTNGSSFISINSNPADFGKLVWVGDTAYVASGAGVRMSTDGGMSFSTVALGTTAVRSVAVSGNNMFAIVRNPAPVQDSVLYSTNSGGAFSTAAFSSSFRFTSVADLFATSNGVLVGSNYGLYCTKNNGNTWGFADSGYHATSARGLATAGPYVFAGAYPMGVYRVRPDSGSLAWEHSGDVADGMNGNVNAIAAKGRHVHVATGGGYFRSADSGATWTNGATGATGGVVKSVCADMTAPNVWMIRNGDLYFSSDTGLSFGHVINSNIPLGIAQQVMKADTMLFVSSFGNLYRSGVSSMVFNTVTGLTGYVTTITRIDTTFYAGTDANGIYSSKDGATWSTVATGSLPSKINVLIPDSAGTALIAGTDDGFYSNTSGAWILDGLAGHVVSSLTMRAGKLFVGTCSGVYSVPYKVPPPVVSVPNTKSLATTLQIWPNPSKGDFSVRVQSPKSGEAELLVQNMMGITVYHQRVVLKAGGNEVHPASLPSLAAGVYTVQLSGEAVQAAGRVVLY